ncbi:unnamed protein product [Rhizoctonia solani]|uniref:Uncharacterized protein n=1 Tax=Rhizoctonia solani TaxID=456999 RepID=A0A8H2ZWB6_9AGAM|nr:unnamed protein product [Rhizoctonia solani]
MDFGLNFADGRWQINNISYSPPDVPTLLKILTDKDKVTAADFVQDEHTYILPKGKVVELHIKGQALGIVHPIHLHGHAFDVVQFGNNPPNYVNPPRRDVVGVTNDGVRIQFRTDNPGPWFLHCHIDWHLEEGFAMVFAEAPEETKKGPQSVNPDERWKKLCQKYDQLPEELHSLILGEQTGTYWYHGHLSSQHFDGLRGPLVICSQHVDGLLGPLVIYRFKTAAPPLSIIIDPQDPHKSLYDIDDEKTVLIIDDWYHNSSKDILASHNVTRQQPDSATINGKGRFNPNTILANPDTLHTVKVKRGKRYRIHVINSSAIASYRAGIQGHKLKVIAADGVPVQPYEVDQFDILAAQRIDCVPLEKPGAACGSKPADLVLNITFGVNTISGNWLINGIPYQSPNIPTLLKILTDNDTVTDSDFTRPEHTVLLPKNKYIELNIRGNSGLAITPIHLHGHTFDIVQFGNSTPNYINPPRRDVIGATDAGVGI